jgi:tetratricopeptide (TPR) repeat protein
VGVGCSARTPAQERSSGVSEIARADALMFAGCYSCLETSLEIFEGAAARTLDGALRRRAFDAAVLLAIRDRELGTRERDHLPRAVALGQGVPGPRTELLLEIARAVPWPPFASSAAEVDARLAPTPMSEAAGAWLARLTGFGPGDLTARYVALDVECRQARRVPAADEVHTPAPADPPVLQFKRATCGRADAEALAVLREAVPAFTEVDGFLGQDALSRGLLLTAERHLRAALDAHPAMLPAALHLARTLFMMEEFEAALPLYERVLAGNAGQVDAMLGRGRALGHLGRHTEAIAVFSAIVDQGVWHLGDAHYWRGWNRFTLGDLPGAEADATAARRLMVNARVHALSGAIAAARSDWPGAQVEFEAALALDQSDCDIPLSLATVLGRQGTWRQAAERFAGAAECLVDAEAFYERRLAELAGADLDAARRERMQLRLRGARDNAHRQQGLARFNAAVTYANTGDRGQARSQAERAAGWPEWAERARELLKALEPPGSPRP